MLVFDVFIVPTPPIIINLKQSIKLHINNLYNYYDIVDI
jgi:hypothetical protein